MGICWGIEPSTLEGDLVSLRRMGIYPLGGGGGSPPASVGPVSSGRFGGNETRSHGDTEVTITREIQ